MADNKNIVVRLMADTSQYEASLAKAGKSTETLASGLEKSGSKTGLVTKGITAAGLAVAAFGVASIKMAADFDEQMSTVQANSGATTAQLGQLRAAALQAGASTVYTAAESAGAINDLAKAGMSVSDILSGGLTASLNLAAAGQMDVGNAAEYMSQALTMFHLSGKDATSTADTLAAGADKAVGDVSDFGEALNNCGAQANGFGMSLQETVGVLGLFAQNGTVGAEAGTQLNSMLMKLSAPSSEAQAEMDKLGISVYDSSEKFVGMANLAGQLKEKIGSLSEEQRHYAMATIFGSYATNGATYIMNAGKKGVEDWTKAVSDSGFAAQQASNKTNNLKGDLKMLESATQSAMTKIGEGAQGPLRKFTQGLTDLITDFGNLPAGVQQAIVLGASLTGILAGLHKAVTPLNTSTSAAAQAFGLLVDPIQRIAIAGPQLKSAFTDITTAIKGTDAAAMADGLTRTQIAARGLRGGLSGIVTLLGGPWGIALTVAGAALAAFASAQQKAKEAQDELKTSIESSSNIAETIAGHFQNLKIGGEDASKAMKEMGVNLTDVTSGAMGNGTAMQKVKDALEEYVQAAGDDTSEMSRRRAVADDLTSEINKESKAYKEASDKVKEKTKAANDAVGADGKSASSAKQAASANKDLGSSAKDAAEEIDGLVKSLFGLESNNLTADEAVDQLNQKIGQLSDTCKDNGVVFDQNGNLLDKFSEKGTKTKQALEDIASSAQNAAEKILKQGESTGFSSGEIERANGVLQDARDAVIRQAEASGMSEQAANALADRWGLSSDRIKASIDNIKKTADDNKAKLDVDDSKAKKKTKDAKTSLGKFHEIDAKATLDADAKKATASAKKAQKMMDDFNKKHVKATLDAIDKASKKAKTASANVNKFNGKKSTAKLDAKDNASPKVDKANAKKLTNKRNTLTSNDIASQIVARANSRKLANKRNTLDSTDKASSKVDAVNRKKLQDKKSTASVNDQATPVLRSINNFRIADKSFTVTEHTKRDGGYTGGMFTDGTFQHFAGGGMFSGYVDPAWAPGNGLSDSVYLLNARLAAGEYTHRAAAVDYYGLETMRAINELRVPREAFSTSRDMPIVVKVEMPADAGATTVNMPMKIVTTQQPSVTGTIIGRTASAAVRSAR